MTIRTKEHERTTAPTCALVIFALMLLCCQVTPGDEIITDELDPTFILDDESISGEHSRITSYEEKPLGLDIQLPTQTSPVNVVTLLRKTFLAANFASDANVESLKTTPLPETHTERLARQLKETRISPPQPVSTRRIPQNPSQENKKVVQQNLPQDGLREIIDQIRSLDIERQPPATTENTGPKTEDRGQKTEVGRQKAEDKEQDIIETETNTVSLYVDIDKGDVKDYNDRILHQVDELLKDPNRITSPFELAEILFKIGKPAQAAVCYKQALVTMPADPNLANERAWVLFQIGNCLKSDDPNSARESYAELVRTHPDSPWVDAAKSRYDLVDWFQKEQPQNLIVELKH